MTTFGRILTPLQPEHWILDLARTWFTDYLAETERQSGFEPRYFEPLESFVTANDFDGYWPEDRLPCLMVMNSGLGNPPVRRGDGKYEVRWLYGCAIIVGAQTRQGTRDAMHVYSAAFTDMMLKNRSLGHPEAVRGVGWVDGRPVPMPDDGDRMLGAAQMFFTVDLFGVHDERGAPPSPEPSGDPYGDSGDPVTIHEDGASVVIVKKET